MLETMRNAWKIDDIRKKLQFTLVILLLYRIGNSIPVPYVDTAMLGLYFQQMGNTVLGLWNTMSGGAFSQATIFALSIQPYINASIIIQLLTIAIPALERLAKEGGEEGKKKIASITRYSTVLIALIQGWAYYMLIKNQGMLTADGSGIWAAIVIIMTFTAGSAIIMWLGEQITEFGVGNGISIILFASIVSRFPTAIGTMATNLVNWTKIRSGELTLEALTAAGYDAKSAEYVMDTALHPALLVVMLVGALAMVVLIILVNDAERRIPVHYAKRVVGRKMYGGQSTNLPLKVNMSGVLPVIFAQSIASLPATVAAFFPAPEEGTFAYSLLNAIDTQSLLYMVVYFMMIIGFSYFYSTIQFNPIEISNNLKRNGGFIPGFRPGKPTSDFISKVLGKITLFGAIYLGIVALMPLILGKFLPIQSLAVGGTSVIIVVGVALETVNALESQMLMRQYKGFLE